MKNVLVPVMLLAVGCGSVQTEPSDIFVGETAAGDSSVAVIAKAEGDGEAAVYLCDGAAVSEWFIGTIHDGVVDATSDDGSTVHATIGGGQVSGTVHLAWDATADFAVGRASGVAGVYLVEQGAETADGYSALGAHLTATLSGGTVAATVEPLEGAPLTLDGTIASFGEPTGVASWIVLADGSVRGRTTTNTAGGGNCSVWTKIRSLMLGVDCSFL